MRYAVINNSNVVIALVETSGGYETTDGCSVVETDDMSIVPGGILNDGVFTAPSVPAPEPTIIVSPYQARVALLNAGLLDLATELGIAAEIPALFQAAQQVT